MWAYGRGIAGRQVPGQPLPDHGSQKYDTDTFFGGSYTKTNPKYYTNTAFKDFRAPDLGSFDVLEQVIPEAKKRGMKTICWYEDVFRRGLPNIEKLQEVELSGKKAATPCFNNPDYLYWLQDITEDWSRSYDITASCGAPSDRERCLMCSVGATVIHNHRPPHVSVNSATQKRVAKVLIQSRPSKASSSSKSLCRQAAKVFGLSMVAMSNSGVSSYVLEVVMYQNCAGERNDGLHQQRWNILFLGSTITSDALCATMRRIHASSTPFVANK